MFHTTSTKFINPTRTGANRPTHAKLRMIRQENEKKSEKEGRKKPEEASSEEETIILRVDDELEQGDIFGCSILFPVTGLMGLHRPLYDCGVGLIFSEDELTWSHSRRTLAEQTAKRRHQVD